MPNLISLGTKAWVHSTTFPIAPTSGHGSKSVPPVNIPIPTKIGSKMGGAPTPKWDPMSFDRQPSQLTVSKASRALATAFGPKKLSLRSSSRKLGTRMTRMRQEGSPPGFSLGGPYPKRTYFSGDWDVHRYDLDGQKP